MIANADARLSEYQALASPEAIAKALSAHQDVKLAELTSSHDAMRRDVDRVTGALDKIDAVNQRLGALGERMATVEERLKHVPTHWQTVGMLGALFAALAGLATFIPTIQHLFGVIPAH